MRRPAGQVMVIVAVALLALIGSAALILLAGSVVWQKNQLQELADATALDSALTIGISCNAAKANAVITEADNFLATRKTRTGALSITPGTCATPYKGTDTFAGGLSATYNYPYRAHQQQVEVIVTLTLPISFGGELGASNTTVTRRAVAQQLTGSVPSISATTLSCTGGQGNGAGRPGEQNEARAQARRAGAEAGPGGVAPPAAGPQHGGAGDRDAARQRRSRLPFCGALSQCRRRRGDSGPGPATRPDPGRQWLLPLQAELLRLREHG